MTDPHNNTEQSLVLLNVQSIQNYILAGDKLKDMIGGSALVDLLTGSPDSLLHKAINEITGEPPVEEIFLRDGGGAASLVLPKKDADTLAQIWPLLVHLHAPGVRTSVHVEPVAETLEATQQSAYKQLHRVRNRIPPTLPQAGPLVSRSERTGLPAVPSDEKLRGGKEGDQSLDLSSVRKRSHIQSPNPFTNRDRGSSPQDFEDITAGAHTNYLAIVHMDGNGLGKLLQGLRKENKGKPDEEFRKNSLDFSRNLDNAAKAALEQTEKQFLENQWKEMQFRPYRKILCAGDDITIVIRAEDAIDFTQSLIEKFESLSKKVRPEGLTAAAGIAFVHDHFPFHMGYGLAESLCGFAKDHAGRHVSSLAFHRVTNSSTGDYENLVIPNELKFGEIRITANPYLLKNNGNTHHSVAELKALVDAISNPAFPKGAVRETVREATFARNNKESMETTVRNRMERIKEIVSRRDKNAWESFERAVQAFVPSVEKAPKLSNYFFIGDMTPLHDALEIKALIPGSKES